MRRFLIYLVVIFTSVALQGQTLPCIDRFLTQPGLTSASIGIAVMDCKDGELIAQYDAQRALIPASVQKLYTTATAYSLLGDSFRFSTQVYYSGVVRQGVLYGDLYVVGCGDPTLGSRYTAHGGDMFLKSVLKSLQKIGVRKIEGKVIADALGYDKEAISPSWLWEDMGNYYASGCYGINYADNTFRVVLQSKQVGTTPQIIRMQPEIEGMTIENHLTTYAQNTDSAYFYGAPYQMQRKLFGAIPANRSEFVVKGDIPNPPLYLAQTIVSTLRNNGIEVTQGGDAAITPTPKVNVTSLCTHLSSPLSEIIKVIMHDSNNLYAESLLRALSSQVVHISSSQLGIATIKNQQASYGISSSGVNFVDGSGLSPCNRTNAKALAQWLCAMSSSSWINTFPIAGKDGTVRNFFKNYSNATSFRLKSGSMQGVQSYAGYYIDEEHMYAIVVLVNNFEQSRLELRRGIEQLLQAIVIEHS